ncbi:MAG TPA: hypothetical protein VK158_06770 [Acidobacteriota bacterium]|nr:hypothetical protein [Acidobacteriota bacterium]
MLTLSTIRKISRLNEMVYGRSDVVHRFGIGMCDPSGRPLDPPPFRPMPVVDGKILSYTKVNSRRTIGATYCDVILNVDDSQFVFVTDVPREELSDLVGKGLEISNVAQDKSDSRIFHAPYTQLRENLSVILATYSIDPQTGELK